MDQIPAAMDRHLDVIQCHADNNGILLGASSLTGRYWFGSLWYYDKLDSVPDVEKCTAGVQLEAGLSDARWIDATKVIVALDTGGVAVWELVDDFRTFVLSHSAIEHDDIVNRVSVSQDKKKAISCSNDCRIKTWDLENFASTHCYKGHSDAITSIEYHPSENELFLTSSLDGRLLLWDTRKARPAKVVGKNPLKSLPTCVAWQPNTHNMAAIGDELGQIIVKDIRMPTENYKTILPHTRLVYRIEFNRQKPSLLASIGDDCRTVIASIDQDEITQLYKEMKHSDFVHGLSWYGSESIVTCGWDSTVYKHSISDVRENKQNKTENVMEVNGDIHHDKQDLIESNKQSYSNALKSPSVKTEGKV